MKNLLTLVETFENEGLKASD